MSLEFFESPLPGPVFPFIGMVLIFTLLAPSSWAMASYARTASYFISLLVALKSIQMAYPISFPLGVYTIVPDPLFFLLVDPST